MRDGEAGEGWVQQQARVRMDQPAAVCVGQGGGGVCRHLLNPFVRMHACVTTRSHKRDPLAHRNVVFRIHLVELACDTHVDQMQALSCDQQCFSSLSLF